MSFHLFFRIALWGSFHFYPQRHQEWSRGRYPARAPRTSKFCSVRNGIQLEGLTLHPLLSFSPIPCHTCAIAVLGLRATSSLSHRILGRSMRWAKRCDRPQLNARETDLKETERWPGIHSPRMLAVQPKPTALSPNNVALSIKSPDLRPYKLL